MKTPLEPDDSLLQSLVEEVNELPQAAAAQARQRRQARANLARVASLLAAALLAVGIWFSQRAPRRETTNEIAGVTKPLEATRPSARQGYVKVYQAGEATESDSIPSDASEREKKLLTALPGVPVLIVKNDAGEIARVHIFER